MSKLNHTPGPWSYAKDPSGIATVAWCGDCRIGPDHKCPEMADYSEHGDQESDARLIAAAPDMYEALRAITLDPPHAEAIARAVLAKIEGEA